MASTEFYVNTDIETVERLLKGYIQDREQDSWDGGPGHTHLIAADNYWSVAHTEPGREFALQLQAMRTGPDWQPVIPRLSLIAQRTKAERIRVTLRYDYALAGEADSLLAAMRRWWPDVLQQAGRRLGTQGGTMERVRTARNLWESGHVSKTEACKRAHIDPRTYDRYVADVIDWENGED